MLSGDVLCDELEPTHATDGSFTTRWLRVVADAPETDRHGAYKAGHILTLTAGVSDKDVSPVAERRKLTTCPTSPRRCQSAVSTAHAAEKCSRVASFTTKTPATAWASAARIAS
jgi:hypothetical protein